VSCHMTGVMEYFSSYKEEEMRFQIEVGNKARCTPIGKSIVTIQRESGKNSIFTDVLHVMGMGMNLISILSLQDKGYNVFFVGRKVFIHHKDWKKEKLIGIRHEKLYMF